MTKKLTRYRLRWIPTGDDNWTLKFGPFGTLGCAWRGVDGVFKGAVYSRLAEAVVVYEGASMPQAKRTVSELVRRFMCREVDSVTVVGKRVKRGRVRR